MNLSRLLVCSVTPYFLEKDDFWFEENTDKVIEARKNQSFFKDQTIILEKNGVYNFYEILRKLDEIGYEKVFQVSEMGEFSQRGGIIDIFPINYATAFRFEFLGNKIETIEDLGLKTDEKARERLKNKLKSQKLFSDLKNLKAGDYLVHLDHGIGRFGGISENELQTKNKYYVIEYAENDKLYVPFGLERKLSRYVGFADPKVSRLKSGIWQKTKKRIKEEAEKLARELLEIYSKREISLRPPYLPDDELDQEIASTFKYEETPDQMQTIREIKEDLEKEEPMDRIVCGDVGFGKTEIALRSAVKAVKSGYQAAFLCPTTILASQHFQNFKERLKKLPVDISLLSRLQTEKEQTEIIEKLRSGNIDIVIGTHRLLSNDVGFKNLGLLIIDDEQRFGVKQKERLKKIRSSIDILSLSATPIPRTLYFALSSLKNISLIQTPPKGRLEVEISVRPWTEKTIKKAIEEELKRKGQVYYLHNRVETMGMVKKFLEKLVPTARFKSAHGRMNEKELINTMDDFRNRKFDVLIATTIIENGLDIPNVNTLIADDAARLGLSEAYQIKGRIGRSDIKAKAFFLYSGKLQEKAGLRLTALKELKELGSGYKIAMRDLEIRGAGNILGKEQSGSINQVGLNLYCQMLTESIEKLKGQTNV